MAYIESHASLKDHPKTIALATILQEDKLTAIGRLQCLWWWAVDAAPDGTIPARSRRELALAVEWSGDPGEVIEAFVEVGFLVGTGDGWRIHDWEDYTGKVVRRQRSNAERQARWRAKNQPVTVTSETHLPDVTVTELPRNGYVTVTSGKDVPPVTVTKTPANLGKSRKSGRVTVTSETLFPDVTVTEKSHDLPRNTQDSVTVTPETSVPDVTVTQAVTDDHLKGVKLTSSFKTPTASHHDDGTTACVTVTPLAPQSKPLPMNGTAQQIVAAFCSEAGIQKPASYGRAVAVAANLAKANIAVEDIPGLYEFACSWGDGVADLPKMLASVDRWRQVKSRGPSTPRSKRQHDIDRLSDIARGRT